MPPQATETVFFGTETSTAGLKESTPRHGDSAKKRRLSESELLALDRAGSESLIDDIPGAFDGAIAPAADEPVTPLACFPVHPPMGPPTPVHMPVELPVEIPEQPCNPWDTRAVAASLPSPRTSPCAVMRPRGRVVVRRKDRPAVLRVEASDLHASASGKRPEYRRCKRSSRDHDAEQPIAPGLPGRRPISPRCAPLTIPTGLSLGSQVETPPAATEGWDHPKSGMRIGPSDAPDRYTLVERIGAGACASVWHATNSQTGTAVAVKIALSCELGRDCIASPNIPGQHEVAALRAAAGHPHVLPLLDCFGGDPGDDARPQCIVTQLADCDLFDYIQRRGPLSEDQARPMFAGLVSGLEAMHGAGYCHRDLKLDNVFLSRAADGTPNQVLLGDLGAAVPCDTEDDMDANLLCDPCGSPSYAAPEVTQMWSPRSGGTGYKGQQADVWSSGIVLYAMVAGEFPFEAASPSHLRFTRFTAGEHDWPPQCSAELVDLLQRMLSPSNTRLTLAEIAAHPWLQGAL